MQTAVGMSEVELTQRARSVATRLRGGPPKASLDTGRLLDRVHEAAAALRRRYHVRRVVLFGSLVRGGRWWGPSSDIDLAVDGLEGREYWDAWRLVEDMIPDRTVDFVDIRMATPSLRSAILSSGVEV